MPSWPAATITPRSAGCTCVVPRSAKSRPALAISHQRVQQIVSAAGGSWWRRAWRGRRATVDACCTWCGRPPAEVNKLIAGPRVYICDSCVDEAERLPPNGRFARAEGATGRKCSFCSKRAAGERELFEAVEGCICGDCLRVSREILNESTSDHPAGNRAGAREGVAEALIAAATTKLRAQRGGWCPPVAFGEGGPTSVSGALRLPSRMAIRLGRVMTESNGARAEGFLSPVLVTSLYPCCPVRAGNPVG